MNFCQHCDTQRPRRARRGQSRSADGESDDIPKPAPGFSVLIRSRQSWLKNMYALSARLGALGSFFFDALVDFSLFSAALRCRMHTMSTADRKDAYMHLPRARRDGPWASSSSPSASGWVGRRQRAIQHVARPCGRSTEATVDARRDPRRGTRANGRANINDGAIDNAEWPDTIPKGPRTYLYVVVEGGERGRAREVGRGRGVGEGR